MIGLCNIPPGSPLFGVDVFSARPHFVWDNAPSSSICERFEQQWNNSKSARKMLCYLRDGRKILEGKVTEVRKGREKGREKLREKEETSVVRSALETNPSPLPTYRPHQGNASRRQQKRTNAAVTALFKGKAFKCFTYKGIGTMQKQKNAKGKKNAKKQQQQQK
ncbi:hypothetical protein niasHT_003552 [Heterodera trifolii]|uniref:Uncharacterized protein n=1 Tax=Heterodera trifolii TaxID=157864 RepID=A0ABD2LZE3_9BILA